MSWVPAERRRGTMLAVALLCLLLVMLFAGIVVRSLGLRQRALLVEERQLQCFWLVESAVTRAVARLQYDHEYTGESWSLPLRERGTEQTARVTIQVAADGVPPGRRRLSITARFPEDALYGILQSRELLVPHSLGPAPREGAAP